MVILAGCLLAVSRRIILGERPAISGNTLYYVYNVYAANESLSYMELLENTVCEAN
jgi:hypothetical protein